jgi:hypothetical protein
VIVVFKYIAMNFVVLFLSNISTEVSKEERKGRESMGERARNREQARESK